MLKSNHYMCRIKAPKVFFCQQISAYDGIKGLIFETFLPFHYTEEHLYLIANIMKMLVPVLQSAENDHILWFPFYKKTTTTKNHPPLIHKTAMLILKVRK